MTQARLPPPPSARAQAILTYEQKKRQPEQWLAHATLNDWPAPEGLSKTPIAYTSYQRTKCPTFARVP